MNNWKLKSILRWENEGGALLPRDCNVHFWNYKHPGPEVHCGNSGQAPSIDPEEALVLDESSARRN